MDIKSLLRPNIASIKPYSSARNEYSGTEGIFLDANENPFGSVGQLHYNRYPDPFQRKLKSKIANIKGIDSNRIFLGNGSDEPIDLLFRAFCNPGKDEILELAPTYGMYRVCADINDVKISKVFLTDDFQIDVEATLKAVTPTTKMVFICSPNNPTGNLLSKASIKSIIEQVNCLVVVDEAYIDFSEDEGFISEIDNYPNLVVLQTFSKAWGLAALRLGMAFAQEEIIAVLNNIKYPYNINQATQDIAFKAIDDIKSKDDWVTELISQRNWVEAELDKIEEVEKVYPSDANFILVKLQDPVGLYNALVQLKVIVRDRSKVALCEGCLRLTIGAPIENEIMLKGIKSFYKK